MMTICYFSVVTLTCIFGCGAGRYILPEIQPTTANLIRYVHLIYIMGRDVLEFNSFRQNRDVFTLSLEDSTSLNSNHGQYEYHNMPEWILPVTSPILALQAANDALDDPELPWESVMLENHKCYLVPSMFNNVSRTDRFLHELWTAVEPFVLEQDKNS